MLNLHKKGGVFLNSLYDQNLIEKYFVANQRGRKYVLSISFQKEIEIKILNSMIASFFLLKGFDTSFSIIEIFYMKGGENMISVS